MLKSKIVFDYLYSVFQNTVLSFRNTTYYITVIWFTNKASKHELDLNSLKTGVAQIFCLNKWLLDTNLLPNPARLIFNYMHGNKF